MTIKSVYEEEFREYGRIIAGVDGKEILEEMRKIPMPEEGTAYEPSISALEACDIFSRIRDSLYGGMPVQLGMCWGHNTKLNCLEYHRDSELNLGCEEFILLLARQAEISGGMLDTEKIKAFRVPAGVMVEIFATTLHYAPCNAVKEQGFRVMVALPRGTNTEKPAGTGSLPEDRFLTARNKWLLAHPDSSEAAKGAAVGLKGENLDIEVLL